MNVQRAFCAPTCMLALASLLLLACSESSGPTPQVGLAKHALVSVSSLEAVADTKVVDWLPVTNFGDEETLSVAGVGFDADKLTLLRFDPVAVAAAASQPFGSAVLEITIDSVCWEWGDNNLALHRMTMPWEESGATFMCADDTDHGFFGKYANNCAWGDRWGLDPWSFEPIPYDLTPTDTAPLHRLQTGTVRFDVTDEVEQILAGQPHHGWLLTVEAGWSNLWAHFGSRESANPPRLILYPDTPPDTNCTSGEHEGAAYWFCDTPRTWEEARDQCRDTPGADLLQIGTAAENEFVRANISGDVWLAGNDRQAEGEWHWARRPFDEGGLFWFGDDGGSSPHGSFANWNTSEPAGSAAADCSSMRRSDGKWQSLDCDLSRPFICSQRLLDACPDDPDKKAPGVCGCGVVDTDTDLDGVLDCKDACPYDPQRTVVGDCGCVGNPGPAPAGTPCDDGVCDANTACDGAGQCGAISDCAPHSSCTPTFDDGSLYWFCSQGDDWAGARDTCAGLPRTALVQIDSPRENAFARANIAAVSWIGGNARSGDGAWRWASGSSDTGSAFWNGDDHGTPVRRTYSNWGSTEPDGAADCARMETSDGRWGDRWCNNSYDFVCETCIPTTCAAEGAECGMLPDGCGGVVDCDAAVGGCSGTDLCFGVTNRCSDVDGKACREKIEADPRLPFDKRMLEINQRYAGCVNPTIDRCRANFFGAVTWHQEQAAALCRAGAWEPGTHNTIEFDRSMKKRAARQDPAYYCRYDQADVDEDLVPDDMDACLDTPPLTATLANGCTNDIKLPGPSKDSMRLVRLRRRRLSDPACDSMGMPAVPRPIGFLPYGKGSLENKSAVFRTVASPPGCRMFYELHVNALLTNGASETYHFMWQSTEGAPYPPRLPAQLFTAESGDDGDRGRWARAEISQARWQVRARNASGIASEWSRWVTMGDEPI